MFPILPIDLAAVSWVRNMINHGCGFQAVVNCYANLRLLTITDTIARLVKKNQTYHIPMVLGFLNINIYSDISII